MSEAAALAPTLAFARQGAGDPLVLVHGYLGASALWSAQMSRFATRFDVIAPDLAGYGASGHLPAPESIEGHAEQVLGQLSRMGAARFHLVGHSMGGMVAQAMVAMAPSRVSHLVLYGTGPRGAMPGRFETLAASRARIAAEGLPATARRIAATWFADAEAADGLAACIAAGEAASLQSARAGLTAMEGWDGRGALAAISRPTLVLWGDRDRSYGWSQPEALWRGIDGARLGVLPGCGHNAHLERPDLFAAMLNDFLPDKV